MSKRDERYQRRKLQSSRATALISITLVLFMLGLLGFVVLHAQKLSEYVRENIGFSIIMKENVREAGIVQLQKILDGCDKSAVVIFQNAYSNSAMPITVVEVDNVVYNESDDSALYAELTPELIERGYEDDEIDDGTGIKCIILWSDK